MTKPDPLFALPDCHFPFPARFPTVRTFILLVAALLLLGGPGQSSILRIGAHQAQDPHQPQNIEGRRGMVVAAHPLAAEAGMAMLRQGGNAVDAALATVFALNVVEPFASGLGGGGFMVIHLAEGNTTTVINFRERAPEAAFPEMFLEEGKPSRKLQTAHGLSVGVPGAPAGWDYALKTYGTRTLKDVVEKAIGYAEKGFTVSPTFSRINKDEYEKLLLNSGEESVYLNGGFPYEPGDTFRNPELAKTLRAIADGGVKEFYTGPIAEKIVSAVRGHGGLITLSDLAAYEVREEPPLYGQYKDLTIATINPPGAGGLHVIQLLNMLETKDVKNWGPNSAEYIHFFSEALRFVFADRARWVGDPQAVTVPVEALAGKKHAAAVAGRIQPDRILGSYPPADFPETEHEKTSTTHLCVVDRWGNIVSLTQSIESFFGSGIVPQGTGFLLNNQLGDFSDSPHSPNAPGPNKQPVSSMGPMIIFQNKTPFLVLGSPGGTRIFSTLAQIVVNVVEFGLNMDEAIEAPRFFSYSVDGSPRPLFFESRIPAKVLDRLTAFGHTLEKRSPFDKYFGGAQGILIRADKSLLTGGADSRRDGHGLGY
ncbi:MAG: gamma-glutamyltransferase [Candidatus Aminicenantes bacterium]|nr:gamma-glutamyltransferase [Candidatus Aminicenantes bacterium]